VLENEPSGRSRGLVLVVCLCTYII
jgi:hypothetical protein